MSNDTLSLRPKNQSSSSAEPSQSSTRGPNWTVTMSNNTMTLEQKRKPSPSAHWFPFLKLPGEIRNKIYEMTLCDFEDPEEPDASNIPTADFAIVHCNIQTQLFQVNSQVHDEAKFIMMTKNNLVEVQIAGMGRTITHHYMSMLRLLRVPILKFEENTEYDKRAFSGTVMRYQTACLGPSNNGGEPRADSMIILHRHFEQLLAAVKQTEWFMMFMPPEVMERHIERVNLINPFEYMSRSNGKMPSWKKRVRQAGGQKLVLIRPRSVRGSHFSVESLIDKKMALLAPCFPKDGCMTTAQLVDMGVNKTTELNIAPCYRQNLSMSKGNSKDLPVDVSTVTQMSVTMTLTSVMEDISLLSKSARDYELRGIHRYAESFYQLIHNKIYVLTPPRNSEVVMALFEGEEQNPVALLGELYYMNCYCRTRNAVKSMQALIDEHNTNEEFRYFYRRATEIKRRVTLRQIFPGFVLSPERDADLRYEETVAYKLMGDLDPRVSRIALLSVERGLSLISNHRKLLEEKRNVVGQLLEQWLKTGELAKKRKDNDDCPGGRWLRVECQGKVTFKPMDGSGHVIILQRGPSTPPVSQ